MSFHIAMWRLLYNMLMLNIYVGVINDSKLSFNKHVDMICKSKKAIIVASFSLPMEGQNRCNMPIKFYVRPILEYTAAAIFYIDFMMDILLLQQSKMHRVRLRSVSKALGLSLKGPLSVIEDLCEL